MPAIHVSDDAFDATVLKSEFPVLVDFFAEWCGPCKMAAPILDQLSDEYIGKVSIVKVDVDQSELSAKFGVMSIPTVILFKHGKEVDRKIGFGGKAGYEEMIKKVVNE